MVRVTTFVRDAEYNADWIGQLNEVKDIDVVNFGYCSPHRILTYPVAVVEISGVAAKESLRSISYIMSESPKTKVIAIDRFHAKQYGKKNIIQACKCSGASECLFMDGEDNTGLVDSVKESLPDQLVVPWIGNWWSQAGGYGTGFEKQFFVKRYRLRGIRDADVAAERIEEEKFPMILMDFDDVRFSGQRVLDLTQKIRNGEVNGITPFVVIGTQPSDHVLPNEKTIDQTLAEMGKSHYYNRNEGPEGFVRLLRKFL